MDAVVLQARSRAFTLISIACFLVVVAVMVARVDVPPVLDYPNHFARIWLLSGGIDEPPLSAIYAIDWSRTSTNIGIDLLAWKLGPFLGATVIAKSALFLSIILAPLGAALLNRYLLGQWHPWQVAIFFFAWCATMIGGFMNFQIGLGLALIFAIADDWLSRRGRVFQFGWRFLATATLFYDHIFAAGFFLLLIVALEFSPAFTAFSNRPAFWSFFRRALIAAITWAVTVLAVMSLSAGGGKLPGAGLDIMWNDSLPLQVWNLLSAIWSYSLVADVVFLIGIVVVQTMLRKNGYRVHAGLMIATLILLLLSIASPRNALATGWISWRFPIMAALAASAMLLPAPLRNHRQLVLVCVLVTVTVFGRTAWIAYNWVAYQPMVAQVRSLLDLVPPGSAVLQVGRMPKKSMAEPPLSLSMAWYEDTYRHLVTLAVPESKSFVPTLFTATGKQPLVVRPQWMSLDVPEDNLISTATLICIKPEQFAGTHRSYLSNWHRTFDYVMVLNADRPDKVAGNDIPGGLDLVAGRGFAQLYRVAKTWTSEAHAIRPAYCDDIQPWH